MAYILLNSNEKIEDLKMDAFFSFSSEKPIDVEKILSNPENLRIYEGEIFYGEMGYALVDQYEEVGSGIWRLTIRDRGHDDILQDIFNSKLEYMALSIDLDLDDNETTVMAISAKSFPHSPKYNTLLRYFKTGLWNESKMRLAVDKGWITMLEFEQITGLKY